MADPVFDYLGTHSLLTLATASKNGIPHAAPVMYANDGTTVYFSIAPQSISASNLAENPVAAIGIADSTDDWNAARGVQIVGNVVQLTGVEAKTAASLFADRYPFLGDAVDSAPFYRLQPHDIRYVDNQQSGGESTKALGRTWVRNVVHRVFRHLRPDEVSELSNKFSSQTFKAGETLIQQGTEGDKFFLIVEGTARATNSAGQELSTSGPGGFVGEIAILAGRPRTATVTAVTDVTVLALSKADFEHVMQLSPDLRREFDSVMVERLERG